MTFAQRLKGAAIALAILIIPIPIAVILTITTSPFWSWVERAFSIEAYGHSGPAEWCYLASYILIVIICILVWSHRHSAKKRL